MPRFSVDIDMSKTSYETDTYEVDAENEQEAEDKAIELAEKEYPEMDDYDALATEVEVDNDSGD